MTDQQLTTSHVLKTHAAYFDAVERGDKTFEVRRNDRAFQVGDRLYLVRTDPRETRPCTRIDCTDHGQRVLTAVVSFVYSGDPSLRDLGGVVPGHVVLGLRDLRRYSPEASR